ncbi:efflux RND transporter periplasmic adaptor subunit [Halothiobacillus sp. DCM-1]|uniref:efflux RND transporter periplasmic adaptor subunit n=1 Tax=Halothiobacillus sp. DCM-1 TaxID=3112558 RepID=UPI00324B3FE8
MRNLFSPLSRHRIPILLPWVLLTSLGLGGCGGHGKPEGATAPALPDTRISARVETISEQSLPVQARFPGSVITSDQVSISSRVMGYVRSVDVHEGQTVKAGQTLLTIDATDVTSAISQARAELGKAAAGLSDAKANFERYASLYKENAVPKQVFDQIQTAYKVAQGNYAAAQAGVKQAEAQLTYVKLTAPFEGTVTSRMVDPGQMAYPSSPLLTLQGGGQKQVEVQVNSQAFATLKLGELLTVSYTDFTGNQHRFQGEIERMVDATDPITHTHTVKIGVPSSVDVRSGNYVVVTVNIAQQPGLVIPPAAIFDRGGVRGVFVLGKDGRAWFRMVRLGAEVGKGIEVLAGLNAGETVVYDVATHLENGSLIEQSVNSPKQAADKS